MKQTIGIIGAGLGGLTIASLLTHQGYKVTIFEKEADVGGRALSFNGSTLTKPQYHHYLQSFEMAVPFAYPSIDTIFSEQLLQGFTFDLGFHVIGGGVVSNLHELFDVLHQPHIDMMETRLAHITNTGYNYPFLSRTDKIKMAPRIIRLLSAGDKTMNKLDVTSMTKTIQRYGRGKMKLTLELFSRVITTVNNLDYISTGETFRAQRNLLAGSKAVGYPKNGLHQINQTLAHYITSHGGSIQTQQPVTHIHIENGKAQSISTKEHEYFFDAVISNVPVQQLFTLADEQQFPTDYVNNIKNLKATGSLCAYYAVSKIPDELIGKTFLFLAKDLGVDGTDAAGMIDCMISSPTAQMAPEPYHLIQAYIICTPQEAKDHMILKRLKEALDAQLSHLIPEYEKQLLWSLYPAVWHLDGVAKTIDNIKPDSVTPIQQLYLVGDCTKAPGIGINCALNSARHLYDHLTQQ